MSAENGIRTFGERELVSRVGSDASRFRKLQSDGAALEALFDQRPLRDCGTIEATIDDILHQLSIRYSSSRASRKTAGAFAVRICADLAAEGYVSWDQVPIDWLPEWCTRNIDGHKGRPPRVPAAKTVAQRRSAARMTVKAAFDAGLMSEAQCDRLLVALRRRRPSTQAVGTQGSAASGPSLIWLGRVRWVHG